MSETFYIKKTAFDDNNFDLATREADSFIIGPGELNGPGGLARDSDLELYGFGSLKWGEGVNQNQYRQLESNACPAKVDGDFLAGGADGNTDFLVASHGIVPKSEEDLGIGNGITEPLVGQLWYNTSDVLLGGKILYTFTATSTWLSSHTLVADLDLDGNTIINLGDPDFAATTPPGSVTTEDKQDALTVGWSDLRYVNKTGDSMEGGLSIDPTGPEAALTLVGAMGLTGNMTVTGVVDINGNTTIDGTTLIITAATTINGNTTLNGDLSLRDNDTISLGNSDDFTLEHNGSGQSFITNATGDLTITNNGDDIRIDATTTASRINLYTNSGFLAATFGGNPQEAILFHTGNQRLQTTTAGVTVTGEAKVTVLTLAGSASSVLTSKSYVDTKAPLASPNLTGTPLSTTPPTSDNSTRIATTAFVQAQVSNVGTVTFSGSTSSTVVPAGVTKAEITITAAGGGGGGGGDGPSDGAGAAGGTGGNTSVTLPIGGTVTVVGGQGGRGGAAGINSGAVFVNINEQNVTRRRIPQGAGRGVNEPGLPGGPAAGNGPPTPGGDGGSTMVGIGGAGRATFGGVAGGGTRGGGGGGGVGQDNAPGEGGDSGKWYTFINSVSAGSTVSWTIGTGGTAGAGLASRNGGSGGSGYIIIRWLN